MIMSSNTNLISSAHDTTVSTQHASPPRIWQRAREEHRFLPTTASYPTRPASRVHGLVAAPTRHTESLSPPKEPASTQGTDSLLPGGLTEDNDTTEFFARLEDEQEGLRDARENLLGSRVRLGVQRRELLETREKASSQAGAIINRIRRLLFATGVDIPVEFESALSELELSQNELGIQEVDYDNAEKAYNVDEWEYTRKESDFMQDLCRGAPARSQAASLLPPSDVAGGATRFSYGPKDIENLVAESDGNFFVETYENEMALPDDDSFSEGQDTVPGDIYRQLSASGSQATDLTTHTTAAEAVQLFLSDKLGHNHQRVRWVGTRRSVDEWLLNTVKVSHFEKARLQVWLSTYTDNDDWWEAVDRNWFLDTSETSRYHTGDTTIPEEDLSNLTVSNELPNIGETSETSETPEQRFSAVPLLAQDRVMDALESVSFPTSIEPQDLIETSSAPPSSGCLGSNRSSGHFEEVNLAAGQSVIERSKPQNPSPSHGTIITAYHDEDLGTRMSNRADNTKDGYQSTVDTPLSFNVSSVGTE